MEDYRKFVRGIADSKWPTETILNRSIGHASIIFENIFRKAQKLVEILTGELRADVFGTPKAIAETVDYLQRNKDAKIHILSENVIDTNVHPLFAELRRLGLLNRIELRQVPAEVQRTYPYHFAVADSLSYRFEKSRLQLEAVVQFGEPGVGQQLHTRFIDLVKKASVVRIQ